MEDSLAGWTMATCASPGSNISELSSAGWSRPWLAYGPTPWQPMLQKLGHCALPRAGRVSLAGAAHGAGHKSCDGPSCCRQRPSWKTEKLTGRDHEGVWVEAPGRAQPIWQPRSHCRDYKWFGFADTLRCLKGRALIFEGDSTVRQLFLRLIWWLRGVPLLVEHLVVLQVQH